MVEPVVCIFPHSDDEFLTPNDLSRFLRDTLPRQPEGRYLLRKLGWKDKDFKAKVTSGSLVLFRKKGWVVGQATVQNPIEKLEPPEPDETERGIPMEYHHVIFFDPNSIRRYEKALPVEALENWSGRRLYPGFYAILGKRQDFERYFPQ